MEIITVPTLQSRLVAGEPLTIMDVREADEHEDGFITDLNIPLGDIPTRIDEVRQLADGGDIVVYCRTGSRSLMAQKMLVVRYNLPNVLALEGGYDAWAALADKAAGA